MPLQGKGPPDTARPRLGLRAWALLLVLGGVVPLLVFGTAALHWMTRSHATAFTRSQTDTVRALALAVDGEVHAWEAVVTALAESRSLRPDRLTEFYVEARQVAAPHDGWVVLTVASGEQLLNTLRPYGTPLAKTSSPETIAAVFRDAQPVVSDIFYGQNAQRYIVAVAVPVIRDGHVIHCLTLNFAPQRLSQVLQKQQLPATWTGAINDRQGQVVARSQRIEERIGKPTVPWLAAAIQAAEQGVATGLLTDGRLGQVAFQRLHEVPWTVTMSIPVAEFPSDRPVQWFTLLGLLVGLGALGVTLYASRQLTRPVRDLAVHAEQLLRGKPLDLGPASGLREIDHLREALVTAATSVQAIQREEARAVIAEERAKAAAKAAEALRLSEEKFAKAFAANPAAIALTRLADGRFFDVNDTYLGITGFRRDEVIGRTAGELGAWPNADSRSRFVAALRQQGAIRGWEERFCKKSGEQFVALLSAEVITVAGEDLVLSTYLDITARKEAEKALRQLNTTLEERVQARTAELGAAVAGLEQEVRQRQQAETHLQRTNRALRLLSACNEALVRLDDESALTAEICRIVVEIGGYRMAWVGMAEADADRTVRPVAARGIEDGYLERAQISWADTPRGYGPTGTAIRTGEMQIGNDFLTEPRLAPWRTEALRRGFRSSIALPLRDGTHVWGALTIYAVEPQAFQTAEVPVLQELADDLAFGIGAARVRKALRESRDRLRALTGDLALAEQRERQRLGQVLHDGLQQFLVAARMHVDLVARRAPDELRASCQQVYTLLGDAITASRALTAELSPPMLHSAGFVPALEWLARWMGDTHHLAVTLHTDAAITVEGETAKVLLFQAVRELLFNAVKHAGVPDATVEVRRHGDTLTIVVADQGAGFDPERAHATGGTGLGLPAIRQRLEYLGGNLVIASAPGQGSRFTLSIPLPPG